MSLIAYLNGNKLNLQIMNNGPFQYSQTVDLKGLDENSWYPVQVSQEDPSSQIPDFVLYPIEIIVYTPWAEQGNEVSWGTYNKHAQANLSVKAVNYGWGARNSYFGYIFDRDFQHVTDNKNPIVFKFGLNNNGFILYLRGGEKYVVSVSQQCKITLFANGLNNHDESFPVVTSEPAYDDHLIDLKTKLGG